MAEDCVYNSMLRASCVHFLGSQTSTSKKTAIDLTSRGQSYRQSKYELTKKRSLGGISGCEIGVFGKEKEEMGDHL